MTMTKISKPLSLVSLVALAGATWAPAAAAETLDCDRLAGSQQMLCVAMTRCAMIDAREARSGCVSAVLQAVGVSQSPMSQSAPLSPAPAGTTVARPTEPPRVTESNTMQESMPQTPAKTTPQTAAQTALQIAVPSPQRAPATAVMEQQPVTSSVPVRPERDVTPSTGKLMSGSEIPKKFSASVVSTRGLIRDRQIVLLDNYLVFEGEGPEFDVGTTVNVSKRGFFGDAYTITSRKSRSKVFSRLRCEDPQRSEATERKCSALMDQ